MENQCFPGKRFDDPTQGVYAYPLNRSALSAILATCVLAVMAVLRTTAGA